MVSRSAYEECRRQRLEENKKRMEELNLSKLSQALKASISPKPSPMKQSKARAPRQPVDLAAVRRSTRVADKPQPNYREALVEPLERPRRSGYSYRRKDLLNRVYASDEARMYAIGRAEACQSGLQSEFPSFIKPMLQSHVTGGFWLGLPNHFCKKHLPSYDEMMTLEDEDGDESLTKYLAEKTGLSGGWRGFAIDHELVDGDAIVFQLVGPTRFKVFIIRVNETKEEEEEDIETEEKDDGRDKVADVTTQTRRSKRVRAA